MIAAVGVPHDVRPPGVEGVGHTRQAKEEHPFAPGLVVHPADAARSHRQRGECADQRPGAGRQNMKVVVLGTGLRTYPLVLVLASRPLTALRSTTSDEHTSELKSLMRISYDVFSLKKQISQ